MFAGIWTSDELYVVHNGQYLEEFFPEWVRGGSLVSFEFRAEQFHDVAERELVDVDNRLPNGGQILGSHM
jgi:hypothetical protein